MYLSVRLTHSTLANRPHDVPDSGLTRPSRRQAVMSLRFLASRLRVCIRIRSKQGNVHLKHESFTFEVELESDHPTTKHPQVPDAAVRIRVQLVQLCKHIRKPRV